jgi:hypothetical protein
MIESAECLMFGHSEADTSSLSSSSKYGDSAHLEPHGPVPRTFADYVSGKQFAIWEELCTNDSTKRSSFILDHLL